jgi:tetratricopeptide (TPR) repeat protein
MSMTLFLDRARRVRLALAACLCVAPAVAAVDPPGANSALDAQLFYQLLIGEMELREGQAGTAYQVMLDAARRTRDETLFRRAVDIALAGRAGEQALAAARAWREALPASMDAHRYLVQLLLALKRTGEVAEPLRSLIALPPPAERSARIAALPRLLAGTDDRRQAAALAEDVLRPWLESPGEGVVAQTALARMLYAAGEAPRSIDLIRRAHARDRGAEGPVLAALEMMAGAAAAEAEPIVLSYLSGPAPAPSMRLAYARALVGARRLTDAMAQLESATRADPGFAAAWLSLGGLHLELRQFAQAESALKHFLELARSGPAPSDAGAAADAAEARQRGVTQARLMLAQSAELRGDIAAAQEWLAGIEDAQRALDIQARRASLLARQGRLAEGRALLQAVPEHAPSDARAKLLAEAQLLRDHKQWADAHEVLRRASERFANDADLMYELAMLAERLNRLDEMESLLRKVIELSPNHHHAYNALGYSLADRKLRLGEARELVRKALALAPGEPFITDSLGWVEYRMGNAAEALRLLREAYRARPDAEIGAHLGEVLWTSGERVEARRIWSQARSRDANNEVLLETLQRLRVDL